MQCLSLSSELRAARCLCGAVDEGRFFAGHYYSASAQGLKEEIDKLMKTATAAPGKQLSIRSASQSIEKPVLAIIAPHASYRYSGVVAARAFQSIKQQEVKRIFLIESFHHRNSSAFCGAALPESSRFATPFGGLNIDVSAVKALAASKLFCSTNKLIVKSILSKCSCR